MIRSMTMHLFFTLTAIVVASANAHALCEIRKPNRASQTILNDSFTFILSRQEICPQTVPELRKLFIISQLALQPSIVNRKGFNNIQDANFQVNESVFTNFPSNPADPIPGQLFITYALAPNQRGELDFASTGKEQAKIQVISWDLNKAMYNFYELVPVELVKDQPSNEFIWIYNGDSADSLFDIQNLQRQPNPNRYGTRSSCTACHTSGNLVLKEMAPPFNDWWSLQRPFRFDQRPITQPVTEVLSQIVDVSLFARNVRIGMDSLAKSVTYRNVQYGRTLPEILRPLFCTQEVQLKSDLSILDLSPGQVKIPSGFLIDPKILSADFFISTPIYLQALVNLGAKFPGTPRTDGDHGFLTPVKSYQDQLAIDHLVQQGIISAETMVDILATDMFNPVISLRRCSLLNFLPLVASSDWLNYFVGNLKRSNLVAAQELFANLTDPKRNIKFHQARATNFIKNCQRRASTYSGIQDLSFRLSQTRVATYSSVISQHPLGQILDPVERVLFPQVPLILHRNFFSLTDECTLRDEGIWIR